MEVSPCPPGQSLDSPGLKSKSVDHSKAVELTDSLKETHYFCESFFKGCFFEQFRLYKIVVILSVTSATCEKSFSAWRIIQSHPGSTVAESRLPSLAVLSIESKHTKVLNLEDFVKRFVEQFRLAPFRCQL